MAIASHNALMHYIGVAAEAIIIKMDAGATIEFDGAEYNLVADKRRVTPISESVLLEIRRRRRFLAKVPGEY